MEIIDLNENYYSSYFVCLEEWSEEMKDAGNRKELWFNEFKDKGLRVKLAIDNGKPVGMIQYLPVEHSHVKGNDLYFINCIWVHGYKKYGVGNYQKKGIGTALITAAEEDVKSLKAKGVAAWGLTIPVWMKASWFKKKGFKVCDKYKMMALLWKPYTDDAKPPEWIRLQKRPQKCEGKVNVTCLNSGICPGQNIAFERAKRAAGEFGDKIEFNEVFTNDRNILTEWGISDAIFVDGKPVRTGPPPSYEKIKKIISKRVRKIKS